MLMKLLENFISLSLKFLNTDDKNEYFLHQVKSFCAFLQYFAHPKCRNHLLLGGGKNRQLAKWDTFETFPEASQAIKIFCARNFHPITIVCSHIDDPDSVNFHYKDMTFVCVHYGSYIPKGIVVHTRNPLHSNCPFIIRISLSKSPKRYWISLLNLKHNHQIGPSFRCQTTKQIALNEEEQDFVKDMMVTSNATHTQILLFIQEFMNKNITIKDISNLRVFFKITSSDMLENEKQEIYVKEVFEKRWIELVQKKELLSSSQHYNNQSVLPSHNYSSNNSNNINVSNVYQQENSDNFQINQNNLTVSNDENVAEVFSSSPTKAIDHLVPESESDYQIARWNTFKSFPEAYYVIKTFCKNNFHPIKILRSQKNNHCSDNFLYQDIVYACAHYGRMKSKSKGVHKRSKTNPADCPFIIKLSLSRTIMLYRIIFLNLQHNHEIGPSIYCHYVQEYVLNVEEKDFVKEMIVTSNAENKEIILFVEEFMNKEVKNKEISIIRVLLKKASSDTLKRNGQQKYVKEIFAKKWMAFQEQNRNMLSSRQDDDQLVFPPFNASTLSLGALSFNSNVLNVGAPANVDDVAADVPNDSPDVHNAIYDSQQIESIDCNQENHNDLKVSNGENVVEELGSSPEVRKLNNTNDGKSLKFLDAKLYTDKLAAVLTQFGNEEYKSKLKTVSFLTQAWQHNENVILLKEENNVLKLLKENVDPDIKHGIENNLDPNLSSKENVIKSNIGDNLGTLLNSISPPKQDIQSKKEQVRFPSKDGNTSAENKGSFTKKKETLVIDNNIFYSQNNLNSIATNQSFNNLLHQRMPFVSMFPLSACVNSLSVNNSTVSQLCVLPIKPVGKSEVSIDLPHNSYMNTAKLDTDSTCIGVQVSSVAPVNKDGSTITPAQSDVTAQEFFTTESSLDASYDSFMDTGESDSHSSWEGTQMTSVVTLSKETDNLTVPKQIHLIEKSCKRVNVSAMKQTSAKKRKISELSKIFFPEGIPIDKTALSAYNLNVEPVEELNRNKANMEVPLNSSMNADESANNSILKEVQTSSVVSLSKEEDSLFFDKNMMHSQCNLIDNPDIELNKTEMCMNVLWDSSIDIDESHSNSSCIAETSPEGGVSCGYRKSSSSYKSLPNIQNENLPVQNVTGAFSKFVQKSNSLANETTNTILLPKLTTCDQVLSQTKNCTDKNKPSGIGCSVQTSVCHGLNGPPLMRNSGKSKKSSNILFVPFPNRYNLPLRNSLSQEHKNSTDAKVSSAQSVPLAKSLVQTFMKSEKYKNDTDWNDSSSKITELAKKLLSLKQDSSTYRKAENSSCIQTKNLLLKDAPQNYSSISKDSMTEVKKTTFRKILRNLKSDLTVADIEDIVSLHMLNDKIMNIGQTLIKIKFPEVCGFQDVLLGSALKFKVVSSSEKFIQIIHCRSFPHWITVSTFDAPPGTAFVYDSIMEPVPRDAIPQICNIMNIQSPCLIVVSKPMQLQTNSVDCGLFALASAFTLLHGKDPSTTVYNASSMRQHFLTGLIKNDLQEFPIVIGGDFVRSMGMTESFPLHCVCRQPVLADSSFAKLKDFNQCAICKKLCHKHCIPKCCENTFISSSSHIKD